MYVCGLLRTLSVSLVLVTSLYAQDWTATRVVGIEYPPIAAAARVQGKVLVRCDLDVAGKVISTERMDKTSIKPDLLGEAAQANAREWVFRAPSDITERRVVLTYIFEIKESENGGAGPRTTRSKFIYEAPQTIRVTAELPPMQIQSNQQPK